MASEAEGTYPFSPELRRAAPGPLTGAAVEQWLVSHIAGLIECDASQVDTEKPFTYYGLSSVDVVVLTGDLGDWLGQNISPTVAWDYPTIESVSAYLAGELKSSQSAYASGGDELTALPEIEQILSEIERLAEPDA